jgi:CRISPR-associated protein Cas5t
MVYAVRVRGHGVSNGFRTPLSQSVHDTLPLPAPTQILGLFGAAAGISRMEMPKIYDKLRVGVVGTHLTNYQDLTRIVKYKSGGNVKEPLSLLIRENLFHSFFTIWYIPVTDISISMVKEAFLDPKYALSLGRDDEILRIDEVKEVELKTVSEAVIHDTVVPFSLDPARERILESDDIMIPLTPVPLPRSFQVNEKLVRKPRDFMEYTFIEGYKIKSNREGALDDEGIQFFPL